MTGLSTIIGATRHVDPIHPGVGRHSTGISTLYGGESIELICESCGSGNPPGTEFCLFCGTYLAWDRSIVVRPQTGGPPSRGPVAYPPGQAPAQPPRQPMWPPGSGAPPHGAPPMGPGGGAAVDQPWLEAARLKDPRPRAVQPAPFSRRSRRRSRCPCRRRPRPPSHRPRPLQAGRLADSPRPSRTGCLA